MMDKNSNLPLNGVVVADFSHVMAGPFASHLLQLMGATIIKIESKGSGDNMRNYGPDVRYHGLSPAFIGANIGKKSIALDLKQAADFEIAKAIVAKADILLENFRPGVIGKLGFSYEKIQEYNKAIIFCSVSGYGQFGPRRDWPAIDNIVQATSGIMTLNGDEGDPPMRIGFPAVDTITGQTAAFAILAALYRRQNTGQGEYIDVAMFDATMNFMTSAITPYLVTGEKLQRTGNTGYSGQPTAAAYIGSDGKTISLGVVQQNQFIALANYLKRTDWLENPNYATPLLRKQNFDDLTQELAAEISKKPAHILEEEMSNLGIPCGMIRDVAEAISLDGLSQRNMKIEFEIKGLPDNQPKVSVPNIGFLLKSADQTNYAPPPRLDENRDEILSWLGLDSKIAKSA